MTVVASQHLFNNEQSLAGRTPANSQPARTRLMERLVADEVEDV